MNCRVLLDLLLDQFDFSLLGASTDGLLSISGIAGAILLYVLEGEVSDDELPLLWSGGLLWLGTIALLASLPISETSMMYQFLVNVGYGIVFVIAFLLSLWTLRLAISYSRSYLREQRIDRQFARLANEMKENIKGNGTNEKLDKMAEGY